MATAEQTGRGWRLPPRGSWVAVMMVIALAGGCGKRSLAPEQLATVRQTFDDAMIDAEPLCILAGPFPYRAGPRLSACDRCQDLEAAGLLARKVVDTDDEHYVEYALSPQGEAVYRVAPDAERVASLQRRLKKTFDKQALKRLAQPRMCFGTTRFHGVADALAPIQLGSNNYLSVKLVAEAKDTSGLLFDPRIAALDVPVPLRPEPDRPALLYPEQVVTFEWNPVFRQMSISDLRYGRWVDE